MDDRPVAGKLTTALALIAFGLASCDVPPPPQATAKSAQTLPQAQAEKDLRAQANAMQRTILEGALAGAALGGGLGLAFGNKKKAKRGLQIGAFAGAAAGTYVAFIQSKYSGKERRQRAIKADLDSNAAEMRTTINVMRQVLALQRRELAETRARIASGAATSADIRAELGQARDNLVEMQKAIDGASARRAEFGKTRGLTEIRADVSAIDADLAALSQQIAAMKDIANELASEL